MKVNGVDTYNIDTINDLKTTSPKRVYNYIDRVLADGGYVDGINELYGASQELSNKESLVMYPSGAKAGTLYSQEPLPKYGDELITNGNFNTSSNWNLGTGWSISDNEAVSDGGAGLLTNNPNPSIEVGKVYLVKYEITNFISGTGFSVQLGGVNGNVNNTIGVHSEIIAPINTFSFRVLSNGAGVGSIDNISIKEVILKSGDFTHSRASIATRVNQQGNIVEEANDVPRIDWGDGSPSLLLEPQSTNILIYSEDFNQSWWTKDNITITPNNIISPDGTLTADLLTGTSGTQRIFRQLTTSITTYAMSVFVKKGTSDTVKIIMTNVSQGNTFTFSTESFDTVAGWTPSYTKLDNGWYKLMFITDSTVTNAGFQINIPTDNETLYIWGAQMEQLEHPTSYIKTTGSTVTRLADVCNEGGSIDTFNSEEGVLFTEVKKFTGGSFKITISDGTTGNLVNIFLTDSQIISQVFTSGATEASKSYSTDTLVYNKIAVKWKLNDFALWVNGVERAVDNVVNTSPSNTYNQLQFANGDGGSSFYGECKQLKVFKRLLSDEELQKLTT